MKKTRWQKQVEESSLNFSISDFVNKVMEGGSVTINPVTGETPSGRFSVIVSGLKNRPLTQLELSTYIVHNWKMLVKTGWCITVTETNSGVMDIYLKFNTNIAQNAISSAIHSGCNEFYDNLAHKFIHVPKFGNGMTFVSEIYDRINFTRAVYEGKTK